MNAALRVGALALLLCVVGCNKTEDAKKRLAVLTCKDHGGYKNYNPSVEYLEVVCKDGKTYHVKWLP